MARKSRKTDSLYAVGQSKTEGVLIPDEVKPSFASFHAGLYARLSLESELNRERNTIENQMALLQDFVSGRDDIEVVREYFDISKTGTNFDRPGFAEMMQDIRDGKINCVIVKDLSRLGRNYVDAGNYIERVFPFFHVRFIAVNDHYDSEREGSGLMVGLSNIFNEHYARDISRKIKSSNKSSWKKGECVAGCLAYGLMKDLKDKHRIVPDPEVAENVTRIFELFIEYKNYSKVARILTQEGIVCPKAYFTKKRTGEIPEGMNVSWIGTSVREILKNRYYIGDSVHGKTEKFPLRGKKREIRDQKEWMVVENTHEALVSRELFEQAQEVIAEIKHKHEHPQEPGIFSVSSMNLLKDHIFCADCGRKMYLKKQRRTRPQYYCSGNARYKPCCGEGHYVMLEEVENAVMKVIHAHIVIGLDKASMLRRLNRRQGSIRKFGWIGKEISRIHAELNKLKEHKQALYVDFSSDIIDLEQYREYLDHDKQMEKSLSDKLSDLAAYQKTYDRNHPVPQDWEKLFETYKNKRKLTKEIVEAFVDRVEVHKDKSLEIRLKYDDILKDTVEIAEKRGAEDGK